MLQPRYRDNEEMSAPLESSAMPSWDVIWGGVAGATATGVGWFMNVWRRTIRLETRMEEVQKSIDRIDEKLDRMIEHRDIRRY